MTNYIILGMGYVAEKHLKAIWATGGNLIASLDKKDSVGILDSYFPECEHFTEIEILDRHLEKLKREGIFIDYAVICTPNYLHDSHIRFGLRHAKNVICEKPVVLQTHNLDALMEWEDRINCILQLRLHPEIIKLKEQVLKGGHHLYDVKIEYITSRGKWYGQSWKANKAKSGGLAMNIGVHLFDMLLWVFGEVETFSDRCLQLKKAKVDWTLSIDYNKIPEHIKPQRQYRKLTVNGQEIDFTNGFAELHTKSYEEILAGRGFRLTDARPAIELCTKL